MGDLSRTAVWLGGPRDPSGSFRVRDGAAAEVGRACLELPSACGSLVGARASPRPPLGPAVRPWRAGSPRPGLPRPSPTCPWKRGGDWCAPSLLAPPSTFSFRAEDAADLYLYLYLHSAVRKSTCIFNYRAEPETDRVLGEQGRRLLGKPEPLC
ncbi:uncharacterized protein LOC115836078 [Nomascus leucogenys]|uniref:uncharacterized protein LOC115836078 n=1 Tax=Nomascus leucogenys TaxID=61853 RepID=UPI00122DB0E2|nr:uncharacterized protein LOC115836078 [Nomascus leucogenys]